MTSKNADIDWKTLCDEYQMLKQIRNKVRNSITEKYERNEAIPRSDINNISKAEDDIDIMLERMHTFCLDKNNY